MADLIVLQKEIAASLYLTPASLEELMKRDFLKNKSSYGVDRMLLAMEVRGWIYEKGGKYHTYNRLAKKELAEYDLPSKEVYKRPTAEEVIKKW